MKQLENADMIFESPLFPQRQEIILEKNYAFCTTVKVIHIYNCGINGLQFKMELIYTECVFQILQLATCNCQFQIL